MKYEISGNIYGMKLWIAKIVFFSVSYKAFLLRYSAPGASSFSIWLCRSRLLIKFSLLLKKIWWTRSTYGPNFLLIMLKTSWILWSFSFFFDRMVENLIAICFHLWTDKIKAANNQQIFLKIKVSLECDIDGFFLFREITLLLLFYWISKFFMVILNQIII